MFKYLKVVNQASKLLNKIHFILTLEYPHDSLKGQVPIPIILTPWSSVSESQAWEELPAHSPVPWLPASRLISLAIPSPLHCDRLHTQRGHCSPQSQGPCAPSPTAPPGLCWDWSTRRPGRQPAPGRLAEKWARALRGLGFRAENSRLPDTQRKVWIKGGTGGGNTF